MTLDEMPCVVYGGYDVAQQITRGNTTMPAKKEDATLDSPVGVRFTATEKKAIAKWAATEEREIAVCIRRLVLAKLKTEGFLK
jgi:hypothetical protein